jgi:hypothetical protein
LGLLLAVLVGSALSGCAPADKTAAPAAPASSGSPAAASPQQPASSSGPPSARPPGDPEPTISLPTGLPKTLAPEPPTDDFQQVVTQGSVRVSGQCVELVTDQLTWTLLGPEAAKLRNGQRAEVTGVPNPNASTPCAGSPLLVGTAVPL